MEKELKSLLEKTLKEYEKIKFDLTYVTKGCIVELEIGNQRNEECGDIYSQLSGWLGYDEFIDFLIDRGVQHNFSGEIYLENSEMCFLITLNGYCYEYHDSDRRYIEFEEDFITNELKIDLSSLGMDDLFNEVEIKLEFYKRKDEPIERLELFNIKNWHKIDLNQNQLEILKKFIESEIAKAIPSYDIDFECEILWEVQCDEKYLDFNYWSTPIKIKLNEIISEEDR